MPSRLTFPALTPLFYLSSHNHPPLHPTDQLPGVRRAVTASLHNLAHVLLSGVHSLTSAQAMYKFYSKFTPVLHQIFFLIQFYKYKNQSKIGVILRFYSIDIFTPIFVIFNSDLTPILVIFSSYLAPIFFQDYVNSDSKITQSGNYV